MVRCHNFGSNLRIFFDILHNERGQEVHGTYIDGCAENILIWGKLAILA